jgi:hypothetical protein
MASVMAIISKAEFKKIFHGSRPDGVTFLDLDRYTSRYAALETLGEGGSLFLVTVFEERFYLVGILENPKHDGTAWIGKKNTTPARNIHALRDKLKFENGKGLNTAALAMSLQTPRKLTQADEMLLRGGETTPPKTKATSEKTTKAKKVPEELLQLMEAAFGEIENEYLDDIRDNPDKVLEDADFSMTIQSIFSGSIDTAKETIPLLEAFAPFVEGRRITGALKKEIDDGGDLTAVMNELVDAYAICGINAFGTAIVALALNRPKDVPPSTKPYLEHLRPHGDALKALLAED